MRESAEAIHGYMAELDTLFAGTDTLYVGDSLAVSLNIAFRLNGADCPIHQFDQDLIEGDVECCDHIASVILYHRRFAG